MNDLPRTHCVSDELRQHLVQPDRIERLCEVQHDAYEAAAVKAGWETQQRSRHPWSEVPEANRQTMRASMLAVLTTLADELGAGGEVNPS